MTMAQYSAKTLPLTKETALNPTSVGFKFKEKYRHPKEIRVPDVSIQTSPFASSSRLSLGLPTPPPSPDGKGKSRSVSSGEDSYEWVRRSPRPRVRARARGYARAPVIHIHFAKDSFACSSLRRPMVDVGVQAGEPSAPQGNPNSWWNRFKRWTRPARPVLRVIMAVAMFFLERVGFGIRLN